MRLVWFTTTLIIILVLIVPAIFGIGIRKIPSGFQPSLNNSQQLSDSTAISQSFTAQKNSLSGFALTIKNPNLINKKNISMFLSHNGQNVRQITYSGRSIPDGGFVNFQFDPISDSQNQVYTATFMAPDANSLDGLELYHSNTPFDGTYQVNGITQPGSLSFITYYAPKNLFEVPAMIYGGWASKLLADLPFTIFYSLLLIITIGYLSRAFSKRN